MTSSRGTPAVPQVVIVGAGYSGLAAAAALQHLGIEAVVLEAGAGVRPPGGSAMKSCA